MNILDEILAEMKVQTNILERIEVLLTQPVEPEVPKSMKVIASP